MSKSEKELWEKRFKEWDAKALTPSNIFAYTLRNDTTMVLQTSAAQPFIIDRALAFISGSLLVYAETVIINESVTFPGKKLGIFCNNLMLAKPNTAYSLGVTGYKGANGTPDGSDATKGGDGGELVLYVEEAADNIFPNTDGTKNIGLFLHANGGDGGKGKDHVTKSGAAGNGGKGGKGGSIKFYFGHLILQEKAAIINFLQDTNSRWPSFMQGLLRYPWESSHAPKEKYQELKSLASRYDKLSIDCTSVNNALSTMPLKGAPNKEELETKRKQLKIAINTPAKPGNEPRDLEGATLALADLKKAVSEVNNKQSQEKPWATLGEALTKLISSLEDVVDDEQGGDDEEVLDPGSPSSKVRGILRNIKSNLNGQMDNIRGNLRLCFKSKPGAGGPAGSGPGGNGTAGQKGEINKQGGVKLKDLAFTESSSSLDIPVVLAQPDQCQMLLNIADEAYFLGPGEGYKNANSLYTRLTRRLHFVPKLLENPQTQPEPPLLTAYLTMEHGQKLTLNAVVQLKQIYDRAQTSLYQLRATQQQDMFGKTEDWSPRLSYTFYRNRIKGLLSHIEILEKNYREYKDAPIANLKSAVEKASVQLSSVIQQKEMLTAKNGPLEVAANQIAVFTPVLKKYRADLKAAISIIEANIRSSLNTDPMIFLDALSQVAFSPEPFMIGVQGLTVAYKTFGTVQSSDGTQVEKSYVVEQFSYCNDDVQKLTEGYQSRKDGTYEVDDPGCAKIIAKREDFTTLCRKFKGSISKGTAETTLKLFDSYVDIIEKRNTAVMTYNGTLHTLVQLIQDKDAYESQRDFFGQEVLEKGLDATLPAARFWVQKLLTDSKRAAFQYISYGERSLRYWGLQDKLSKKVDYSLIKPSSAISQYQEQLEDAFTSALERYSTNPKNMFPGRTARHEKSSSGVIWALSKDEVDTLCRNDNHAVYIKIPAPRKGEGVDQNPFYTRADVRIDQVRLWLPNAKVEKGKDGKRMLLIHLNHTGRESVIRDDNHEFNFSHDNTRLTFRYDPTTITGLDDITKGHIHDEQDIGNNFSGKPTDIQTSSTCPIGPFALWYIRILPNEHVGLDLSKVEEGYLEFWGSNVDFSN